MFVATKGFSLVTQTVEKQLPSLQEGNKPTMVATWWRGDRPHYECFVWGPMCLQFQKWYRYTHFFEQWYITTRFCCAILTIFFSNMYIYIYSYCTIIIIITSLFHQKLEPKRCRNSLIHVQTWKVDEPPLQPNTKKNIAQIGRLWKSRAFLDTIPVESSGKRSNLFSL